MSRVKRLLVPTDFSPTSDIAFNYALDMAAREGASIRLLHVIEDASFAAAYPDGLFVELPGLREKLIDEAGSASTRRSRPAPRRRWPPPRKCWWAGRIVHHGRSEYVRH